MELWRSSASDKCVVCFVLAITPPSCVQQLMWQSLYHSVPLSFSEYCLASWTGCSNTAFITLFAQIWATLNTYNVCWSVLKVPLNPTNQPTSVIVSCISPLLLTSTYVLWNYNYRWDRTVHITILNYYYYYYYYHYYDTRILLLILLALLLVSFVIHIFMC